ncbi:WYL domain-containing protein [Pseudomonas yamanorum]|nr:WYL domain-containing protein [Pseudomonas yamanorum]
MAEHDTLAQRLGIILTKLNGGQRLSINTLAEEFNVSERTIQRDLNVRLAYLPLQREGQHYSLDPSYFGRSNTSALFRLCEQVGATALFPNNHQSLFSQWLAPSGSPVFFLSGFNLDSESQQHQHLKPLAKAITNRCHVSIQWQGGLGTVVIAPYLLINHKGCWHLAGVSNGTLIIEPIANIIHVEELAETFMQQEDVIVQLKRMVANESMPVVEVILKAAACIAHNFLHRIVLPQQSMLKVLDDGSLLLSSHVIDVMQLLPTIKAYLPHLLVISPVTLQAQLKRDVKVLLSQL